MNTLIMGQALQENIMQIVPNAESLRDGYNKSLLSYNLVAMGYI